MRLTNTGPVASNPRVRKGQGNIHITARVSLEVETASRLSGGGNHDPSSAAASSPVAAEGDDDGGSGDDDDEAAAEDDDAELLLTASAALLAWALPVLPAGRGSPCSGLGAMAGLSRTIITDMLSREPRRRQWSIKHSQTAPRSQGLGGGGGCSAAPPAPEPEGPSLSPSGSSGGISGRPSSSISRTLSTTSAELITSQMPSLAIVAGGRGGVLSGCSFVCQEGCHDGVSAAPARATVQWRQFAASEQS